MKITIRPSKKNDLIELQQLFVDTITYVCKNDYSADQIKVWTATIQNTQRWTEKLTSQYFLIAEINNRIVGFASLENNDYLDFLYVHKDFQRQGIANKLYCAIENEAMIRNAETLNSVVSITAKPFFEKKGFITQKEQTNLLEGVKIVNYKMSKQL